MISPERGDRPRNTHSPIIHRWKQLLCLLALTSFSASQLLAENVFPEQHWVIHRPEELGLDPAQLNAVAETLGGRGCAIKDGFVVKMWGSQEQRSDLFSSSKPILSTLLMFALREGRIRSFDQQLTEFGWPLRPKDRSMTLRHLTNMVSGYARPEPPGSAWAYNDYAIQLYQKTLFDKIFRADPEQVVHHADRFGALGLEDGFKFRGKNRRVSASVRDLARVAWFWLNRGAWNGRQVLPREYFDHNMRPQVPKDLPNSVEAATNDYLQLGTYGGESNHFSTAGPGIYGFNWWFNSTGPQHPTTLTWPDAPADTIMSLGHGGNNSVLMPSLNFVVVALDANWGPNEAGVSEAQMNQNLKEIAYAGTAVRDRASQGTSVSPSTAVDGRLVAWHPLSITFTGPKANESDNHPNPFLDLRLQVLFTGPTGKQYDVPGFFDGDGRGGSEGTAWRVRFTPDEPGTWRYEARFRRGPAIAVSLESDIGEPIELPGLTGTFDIAPRAPSAPGFLKWGRLEYANCHYLKFRDGPYWIRGGTDEPEDFLGYAGFVRTPAKHKFAAHVEDWRDGDPDWGDGHGRGIIGALNYLAASSVNSIYFLTMNVGGDGKDVWPWVGPIDPQGSPHNDNLHFDVAKLAQWETVFAHAQRQGISLHVVFNEAEEANKRELDDGELGTERKLYYRELIARFGHHLALGWNLCEEYNLQFDFGAERIRQFADFVRKVDPYDHPVTVHSAGDPLQALRFTFGDPRFSLTSIQLNQRPIHKITENFRRATKDAGRPLPVCLDEFTLDRGQRASHIPVDEAEGLRREKLWPTYLSGGNIEFILQDLLRTDSFKTAEREKLWQYLGHARRFMEKQLPFWEMEPADELSRNGGTIPLRAGNGQIIPLGPQVFAKRGRVYAVYLPTASPSGTLNLGELRVAAEQRWYNPRTGQFVGPATPVEPNDSHPLGVPPADPTADWVVLIRSQAADPMPPIDTGGFRDGAHHWRKIRDDSRVIQPQPNQPRYLDHQIAEIAANILLFQRANGGWPKDYDMLAVLTEEQKAAIYSTRDRADTSFDNHNIHTQVEYLARAYMALGDAALRDACIHGFDLMLAAQLSNGGYPQRFPSPTGYAAHITFNDGVMIGILNVFKDAADGAPHFAWLDGARRSRAQSAVDDGIDCILKCQIRTGDQLTGWCQQHDQQTFEAASARTFELASICPQETTAILQFLMRSDAPSPEVLTAVDAGAQWLNLARLKGVLVERVAAPLKQFQRHTADFDIVVKSDDRAPPIWARHYEIGMNRPIFAGRDGIKRYSLAEIERERRTGTPWYGVWPHDCVTTQYPEWKRKLRDRHAR